eukprot:evm.model.scf_1961.2 EVM.evm.TU.scf_1961.2   scf_1961:21805-28567(-)
MHALRLCESAFVGTQSEDVLSRGATRVAYKGQDTQSGEVVAWNQLPVSGVVDEGERGEFEARVAALLALSHPNVLKLHACWIDEGQQTMNYLTEYFNPGPLRRHRKSRKRLSGKAMREWTWQILQGLLYLHEQNPPMIHRELRCDTVFIHGTTGDVKVANLGLSTLIGGKLSNCNSVIGSPEFMAPELFKGEKHDAKVDVYGFGMLLLELATQEFPYRECKNTGELLDCFEHGRLPQALFKVDDLDARDLIEMCISHDPEERPESKHLLGHPFFDSLQGHSESSLNTVGASLTMYSQTGNDIPQDSESSSSHSDSDDEDTDSLNNREYSSDSDAPKAGCEAHKQAGSVDVARDVMSCELSTMEGTEVGFELCVVRTGNIHKRVKFTYDVAKDNVEDVVNELERKYDLIPSEKEKFRKLLYEEVGKPPMDVNSAAPSIQSSIYTDGKATLSDIFVMDETADKGASSGLPKTLSTVGDLYSADSRPCSPKSKDFWAEHQGHDVSLESKNEDKSAVGGHKSIGAQQPPGDWNNFKVVTMGPNHGGSELNRASVDSKDHRGFCDAFLPKWAMGYGSFMEG